MQLPPEIQSSRLPLKRPRELENFEYDTRTPVRSQNAAVDLFREHKRRRKTTHVEEEIIEYEDTHPDEYAGPVYRGKFWLVSIELAKIIKSENEYTHIPVTAHSDSYSDNSIDHDAYSQWDDKPIPMPLNNFTTEVDGPRLPPRVEDEDQNFQPPHPESEGILHSYNNTTNTDVSSAKSKSSDKKKIKKKVVTLYCNHCEKSFKAKPTFRPKFMHYLVNHACSGVKRHQYVVGVKHRKCPFSCDSVLGCICLASRRKLKLSNLVSRPPLVTLKNS